LEPAQRSIALGGVAQCKSADPHPAALLHHRDISAPSSYHRNACSISAIRSSGFLIPTEMRISASDNPLSSNRHAFQPYIGFMPINQHHIAALVVPIPVAEWEASSEMVGTRAVTHMLLLGRKTSVERVAAFLLEMDKRLTAAGVMVLPMCRRDIADCLGLTLETVSRALSHLHGAGVLDFPSKTQREIIIRDRTRLAAFDFPG